MATKKIYVTRPYLPPKIEFDKYVNQIWESKELTNSGRFHNALELELSRTLGVKHISLFSNGTIALIVALKALKITGEVITTPYSFVATGHALVWNEIKPIFVDIENNSFNIDPIKVEAAITKNTTAILAVHCYGYPANLDALFRIAKKYKLYLLYDAAHAFGVSINNKSILNAGDMSILSFHATKVFNTFEGGAIICKSRKMKKTIDSLKNFGFVNETNVNEIGINGKMAEINAALGLAQLPHLNEIISNRRYIDDLYRNNLSNIKGIKLYPPQNNVQHNYSYFPITIDKPYPLSRDELFKKFREKNIIVRRYFYPLISDFAIYKKIYTAKTTTSLKNAKKMSAQVLCLPIYPGLDRNEIYEICKVIKDYKKE